MNFFCRLSRALVIYTSAKQYILDTYLIFPCLSGLFLTFGESEELDTTLPLVEPRLLGEKKRCGRLSNYQSWPQIAMWYMVLPQTPSSAKKLVLIFNFKKCFERPSKGFKILQKHKCPRQLAVCGTGILFVWSTVLRYQRHLRLSTTVPHTAPSTASAQLCNYAHDLHMRIGSYRV